MEDLLLYVARDLKSHYPPFFYGNINPNLMACNNYDVEVPLHYRGGGTYMYVESPNAEDSKLFRP